MQFKSTLKETFVVRMGMFSNSVPSDTQRKMNIHNTFRRRPGRLLNVVCTFSLFSVYKGYDCVENRRYS